MLEVEIVLSHNNEISDTRIGVSTGRAGSVLAQTELDPVESVSEFWIRIRPNIGSDPIYRVIGLSGSESSVSRVWASDWAGLFDRVKITENTFFWAFFT